MKGCVSQMHFQLKAGG